MIFIYPIGIPVGYLTLLTRHRFLLSDEDKMIEEEALDYPHVRTVSTASLGASPCTADRRHLAARAHRFRTSYSSSSRTRRACTIGRLSSASAA